MLWLIKGVWAYRAEIAMTVQLLAALRKSAREATQDYIRKRVATKLKAAIAVVTFQFALLLGAYFVTKNYPSLHTRLFASAILWAITLFNLSELLFVTIPELRALHRTLKGKVGYALKYFLEISLVTELLRLNILFLAVCLVLGVSSRTWMGSYFSYTKPWVQWARHGETGKHRTRGRAPLR